MYTPNAFAETDRNRLFDFIEQYGFATLVSQHAAESRQGATAHHDVEPVASHLPLLLDRTVPPQGRLIGHMARANSQWQTADGRRVLAIFHGPHAYVSPTWYEEENAVPTWNYVVVHAYGVLRRIDDRERLRAIAARTVETYESSLPTPWRLDSQHADFIDRMLEAIVGFEIDVDRLEGKWKLNQNQSPQRRGRVARALEHSENALGVAVARLMQERPGPDAVP